LTPLGKIPASEHPPIAKGRGEAGGIIHCCECNQACGDALRKCGVNGYLSGFLAGIAVVLRQETVQVSRWATPRVQVESLNGLV